MSATNLKQSEGKPDVILAYAANREYSLPLCAAIESVLETGSPERIYRIFVLHEDLPAETVRMLEGLGNERTPVCCLRVGHLVDENAMYAMYYFTREMYFRLLIPSVLPEFDKVLYLDCDTIALTDVGELFDTPLGGAVLGAVADQYEANNLKRLSCVLPRTPARYINSGVLLMDCRQFRQERLLEQCLAFLRENGSMSCPDQDAVNTVCDGKIRFLEDRWNVFWENTCAKLDAISMLHYSSNKKPWNSLQFPRSEYFWRAAEKTPAFGPLSSSVLENQADVLLNSNVEEVGLRCCRSGSMGMRYILKLVKAYLNFKMFGKTEGAEDLSR